MRNRSDCRNDDDHVDETVIDVETEDGDMVIYGRDDPSGSWVRSDLTRKVRA